jgi:hemolysin activation/secretion protein
MMGRILLTTLLLCLARPTWSQNADRIGQGLSDRLQNQNNTETESERRRLDRARAERNRDLDLAPETAPPGPQPGGPCFRIRSLRIAGHEPFGMKPLGYAGLIGKCATAVDIAATIGQINDFYRARGFITTRAYLPVQDISKGALEIVIVPGRVEGFVYGDGRQADSRINAAFPNERGDLLNLRDLEQGLDNYNAPQSARAKFRLIPGEKPGGSFVQVLAEDDRQFYARLATINDGFRSTGVFKTIGTLDVDNLLGLNDQISLALTSTPFDNRDMRYADAVALSANVPYGNWLFGLDAGASRYHFILDGVNQSYPVNGHTSHVSLSAERLLMRDESSKLFAYGALKLSRSRSFIEGYEIESQRRDLTIATLGLRGESTFDFGRIDFDIGSRFGVDAFGSRVPPKSAVDPQFDLFFARLGLKAPLGDSSFTYKGTLSGQWSNDSPPGSEFFSVGGWGNVRGFQDDNMYGPSGVYLRNTLEWRAWQTPDVSLTLRSGIDVGYVKPMALRVWDQKHIVGASLGAEFEFTGGLKLTFDIAHALDRPSDFKAGRMIGYVGLVAKF